MKGGTANRSVAPVVPATTCQAATEGIVFTEKFETRSSQPRFAANPRQLIVDHLRGSCELFARVSFHPNCGYRRKHLSNVESRRFESGPLCAVVSTKLRSSFQIIVEP